MSPARRSRFVCGWIAFAGFVAGCSQSAEDERFVVRDSAGVRIVLSRSMDGDEIPWSMSAAPSLTVGAADGAQGTLLHRVRAALRLPDGGIAVADANGVHLYGPSGTYLRDVGRLGQGPGEFADPKQLLLRGGDTLVVWDVGRYRVNLFSLDGTLLRDWAVERPIRMEFGRPSVITNSWLLSDLRVLTQLRDLSPRGAVATGITRPRQHAVQQAASGGWDTVATFVGDEEARVVRERPAGDEPASVTSLPIRGPHGRRSVVAIGGTPSRVCIGEQNDLELRCFDGAGSETRLRWEAVPVRVTSEEMEGWLESTVSAQAGMLGGEEGARAALAALPVPGFRPPYGDLWIDSAGNVWAQIPPALNETTSGAVYRVFSADGRWIGELQVPDIRFLEIGDDYVLGLARDELGVEYIVVYRLNK